MVLRELIERVATEWPTYRKLGFNDKSHPTYRLVEEEFVEELERLTSGKYSVIHKGSVGLGNISLAPWVGSFDPRITDTAMDGFYPVYLFSRDLKRVYLSFALGATQFDRQFGQNNKALSKMRDAARKLRGVFEEKGRPPRLTLTTIDLSNTPRTYRYSSYEADTIYSYPAYDTSNLPPNSQLEEDYLSLLKYYVEVVTDPAIPTIEDLVEASISNVSVTTVTEYQEFVPRPSRKRRATGNGQSGVRRSKESRKVGDAGEKIVVNSEKHKLIQAGRADLAQRIDHHAARNDTPGWDITSYEASGEKIYIEVKSTKGKNINALEITRNEWKAATSDEYANGYRLYLVTEALSSDPKIEVFARPGLAVAENKVTIAPSVYELTLGLV